MLILSLIVLSELKSAITPASIEDRSIDELLDLITVQLLKAIDKIVETKNKKISFSLRLVLAVSFILGFSVLTVKTKYQNV